jgi:hypothetical protein
MLHQYFNAEFTDPQRRESFYEHTEGYIRNSVTSWINPPDTATLAADYWKLLKHMNNQELAFLVLVTGYIPEFYKEDSSQETLYSKLVEVIVAELFVRVGFKETIIQKQKASKEDVTIRIPGKVIVCDAKTYRLGRSQAAPNVKDTLKKADYEKWLASYDEGERVGGLITFPSLFRWKGGSDAYLYCTDFSSPIALTLYEHLAFMLIAGLPPLSLIRHLTEYKTAFPQPTKIQSEYFKSMDGNLFGQQLKDWESFKLESVKVIAERVEFSKRKILAHLKVRLRDVKVEVEQMAVEELRPKLVESMYSGECSELERQLKNINRFRKPTLDI